MIAFGAMLPRLRRRIDAHMRRKGVGRATRCSPRSCICSRLTLIRVGNEDYARTNQSYGLTTLRNRHVEVDGGELRFQFKGKSGKMWKLKMRDRRIARIVQPMPGPARPAAVPVHRRRRRDARRHVERCERISARDRRRADFTAKDFRTWAGTVLAAMALGELEAFDSAAAAKKNVKPAIEQVAARLGNTPTICRKCYVHPQVVDTYLDGKLAEHMRRKGRSPAGLQPEEAAVLSFLKRRVAEQAAAPRRKRVKRAPPSLREQMAQSVAT